jgi:hypothetical protein
MGWIKDKSGKPDAFLLVGSCDEGAKMGNAQIVILFELVFWF